MDKKKLTLCILLLLSILIIAVFGDDNADSGSTTPAGAAVAGSYDSLYQGWKVSLYVAKADYVDMRSLGMRKRVE